MIPIAVIVIVVTVIFILTVVAMTAVLLLVVSLSSVGGLRRRLSRPSSVVGAAYAQKDLLAFEDMAFGLGVWGLGFRALGLGFRS